LNKYLYTAAGLICIKLLFVQIRILGELLLETADENGGANM
jgi:hypothetical protein